MSCERCQRPSPDGLAAASERDRAGEEMWWAGWVLTESFGHICPGCLTADEHDDEVAFVVEARRRCLADAERYESKALDARAAADQLAQKAAALRRKAAEVRAIAQGKGRS